MMLIKKMKKKRIQKKILYQKIMLIIKETIMKI